MNWKPIMDHDFQKTIWVLKYDIFFYPKGHDLEGNFCYNDTPNAQKFTDCHAWFETEEEALKVLRNFPKPSPGYNGYRIEKVYKGVLK